MHREVEMAVVSWEMVNERKSLLLLFVFALGLGFGFGFWLAGIMAICLWNGYGYGHGFGMVWDAPGVLPLVGAFWRQPRCQAAGTGCPHRPGVCSVLYCEAHCYSNSTLMLCTVAIV